MPPDLLIQAVLAVLCGALVGFSLALIGGGGSILATPLLLYVVGVRDPHPAIGTSALAVAANAFANLLPHARAGHVHWKAAFMFTRPAWRGPGWDRASARPSRGSTCWCCSRC